MCQQSQCAAHTKVEEPSSPLDGVSTTTTNQRTTTMELVASRRPFRRMGRTTLFLLCSLLLWDGVRAQTTAPTTSPTIAPTAWPTGAPFAAPTNVPTRAPTTRPTGAPFAVTRAPSTLTPTSRPTGVPTTAPSTMAPTTAPSMGPSWAPIIGTRSPVVATSLPTVSPTSAPSLALQRFDFSALMQLEYLAGPMNSAQRIDWEATTEAHIRSVLRELNYEQEVLELIVATDVSVQTVLDADSAAGGGSERRLRRLEDSTPLKILQVEFSVRVTFRSAKTDYNVVNMVGEAFNSQAERNRYVQRLQQTNPAFSSVSSVFVLVDGKEPAPTETPAPEEDDDLMLFIIAGAGGGAALVTLGLCFLYCNRSKGATTAPKKDAHTTSGSDSSPAGLAADILVAGNNDDISTLGDPVITTMMTRHNAGPSDEHTASVHNDYDYSREYRLAHGIASDVGSQDRNESVGNSASIFSSEHSLEHLFDFESNHRFEVVVPPGKLGIVMDNSPSSGTPMVYAVKPNSVLSLDVRIGDRLISVDDEDVTIMSAIQVSKLISLKNDQERTLVFVRKRETGIPADV